MSSSRSTLIGATVVFCLTPMLVATGQSVAVSPFVSYVPSATSNPLAGFAFTFGGTTGLALRSGAEISISSPDTSVIAGHYRPWGADADAMLFLSGLGGGATVFRRALSPYLFAGIGLVGGDSAGRNNVSHNWSYGVGATVPLGRDADLFGEARWRLSQYVLPTAHGAPDSKSAVRFGLAFHVGGRSNEPPRRSPPRRRHRTDRYEDDDEDYAVTRAPAAAPSPQPQVVVVQPPPAPPPQVVVVQPAEPEPSTTVNINLPGVIVAGGRSGRHHSTRIYVTGSDCSRSRSRRGSSCVQRRYGFDVVAPKVATKVIEMRTLPVKP